MLIKKNMERRGLTGDEEFILNDSSEPLYHLYGALMCLDDGCQLIDKNGNNE